MARLTTAVAALAAAAAPAAAQDLLFALSQPEQTLSGSGGTVLKNLWPNEVAHIAFTPCPIFGAEKWGPRTCYDTLVGDEDGDGVYWEPGLFGSIDALVHMYMPGQIPNPRSVFWSPSAPVGTNISGGPGLRPGDTGRFFGQGQVQYFLSAEQVQSVLGLPATPISVDVDAIAADGGFGIFFSLDQDTVCSTTCGVTFVRDGDVLMIPPPMITWTPQQTVAAVVPGSAVVVWDEATMDLMVQGAQVTDALGNCVTAIQDLESLDIDWAGRQIMMTFCSGSFWIPSLLFSGELMTGASVLTTDYGGPAQRGCGQLGRTCGTGPTLGDQMGLLPPIGGNGVPSHVTALDTPFFTERFVIEPKQHVIPVLAQAQLDVYTPLPFTVIAVDVIPATVAPNVPFPPPLIFPDLFILNPPPWTDWWLGPGFTTRITPPIPVPAKLVFQCGGPVGSNIALSAPATVDVQ